MRHALTTVTTSPRRRGSAFVYLTVAMTVMFAMASIAVDYGKVVVTRSELQTACDAAARYGAAGLKNILPVEIKDPNDSTKTKTVQVSAAAANATLAAASNKADGSAVVVDPKQDVELVVWNKQAHKYSAAADPTQANAVRVTVRRTAVRGNATPLMFGGVVRHPTHDIVVSSIAMLSGDESFQYTVPATSNPFLAGMPGGSTVSLGNPHNKPDNAGSSSGDPKQSPVYAAQTNVSSGQTMSFDGVNGAANNDITSSARYTADGNLDNRVHNWNPDSGSEKGTDYYNENKVADMRAPINCLVGVFLTDKKPTASASATPANLDFDTAEARNYTTLTPQLQQIFFIGDGRTDSGEVQHVVVPEGATRLFIATWDSYEWNNNVGTFSLTIHNNGKVSLVQ